MTSMVQIGSWSFLPDNALGATHGFNTPHSVPQQTFTDMLAMGMTRIRVNVVMDGLINTQADGKGSIIPPSASPSTWNWGFLDTVIQQANQAGIRVTLIARGLSPVQHGAWSVGSECDPGSGKFYTTAAGYAIIAVALARRYSGDGNPDNKLVSGKALQADCIEIGNEEFNTYPDSTNKNMSLGPPLVYSTNCDSPMRYVNYVRTVMPQLRASSASGGGGWVPRNNFQARVGQWGIVHSNQKETKIDFTVMTAPPTDATWNAGGNHNSIFGFDPSIGPNGTQMLDYANFHNYTNVFSVGGTDYDQGKQCADIRAILNAAGNTSIPIWCTETGADGPCSGATILINNTTYQTEPYQAAFFTANSNGTGAGVLPTLRDNGCQHVDIFTVNDTFPNTTSGTYLGQDKSVTASLKSNNNTFVKFAAFTNISNFNILDNGAWAAKAAPAGFGGSSSPPPPPPPGPPPPPPPGALTTVATDSFANRTLASSFGLASDGVDTWTPTAESGSPTYAVSTSTFGAISGLAGAIGVQLLGSLTETDCDAVVRVKVTATGDNAGVLLRANSGGTVYYRCSLVNHILECAYFDGTTQNDIYQSAALTYKAGVNYWIRFRIVGTSLMGRYWADGTTEPSDFTNAAYAFTITDTNLSSGKFGVRARPAANSDIINFDSFTASSVGASPPPPPGPPPPPPGTSATLTGAFTPMQSATINLTNEGAADWAHWNGTTFDHKSSGGSQISNFTTVGNGSAQVNPSALNTFVWSDGTPDASGNTATGAQIIPAATGTSGAPGAAGKASTPNVMVVALENHAYSQVIGNSSMPHINSLATTYGTCTNFFAISHPSLPNYIAFASGSDQKIINDTYNPQNAPLAATTLVDQMATAGIAWKHYQEHIPSTGYLNGDSGTYPTQYTQHHNPWVYFKSIRTNSAQFNRIVNYTQLATDLSGGTAPPFIFVTPGNENNGHTGSDSACDNFVNSLVTTVQASTWYTSGNGIIILWWDESHPDSDVAGIGDQGTNTTHGGHTACIVISALNSANVYTSQVNTYGMLHAIENLYGLTSLADAQHTVNGDLTPLLVGNGGVPPPPPGPPPPPPPPPPTTSNLGNGIRLTFPADTNTRTANIYTDVNQGIATLAASLSDDSAPDFYDSTLANKTATSAGQYALTYAAAGPGQSLTVLYTLSDGTTPGTAKASDTFNRANHSPGLGTSSDGETYTLVTEAGTPAWSIVSNQAQLTGTLADTSVALLGSGALLDCEAVMVVNLSNLADSAGLVLRAASNATSYYRASLSGSLIVLAYVNAGVSTILVDEPATLKVNTAYWLRFRILKNSLYARYWPNDGTKEPKTWHAMTVDRTIETAGQYGFRGVIGATSDTIVVDTYSIVDLSSNNDPSSVSLYAADLPTGIVTTSGALSVSSTTPSGTIDVTSEGTGDWAHWGYPSATSFDHKASVTQLISNYTNIGSGVYTQNTSALLAWSWEDGLVTPTVVASTTETDVTQVGNGFSFSLPADTNSRQVFVYVSAIKAQGKLIASLSDGSATSVTDTSLNDVGTGSVLRYAITYNAGSANQTLTIQWLMLTDNGTSGGLTTYSTDTFTRANAGSWGSASDGTSGAWAHTVQFGTVAETIASNKGSITATANSVVLSLLGAQTQANAEGLVRWSTSNPSGDVAALVLRATSTTTYYRLGVVIGTTLTFTRRVAGTDTVLSPTATVSVVAGTKYWIRFRINGSNLYGKFWADGSSEPAGWTVTATDTGAGAISGAGQWGVRTKLGNGDTVLYDSYSVTNFGSGGGGTPGAIGLDAATVPLIITVGPPPPPPPPQAVNATFTVNANNAISPNTWQGLGMQVDSYLGPDYTTTVLADAPIRYYKMNEAVGATTVIDYGSQAQPGTIHGVVTAGQTGLIANSPATAMLFDGSTGYIDLPITGLPTGAAVWSADVWYTFPGSLPPGGTYESVFQLGNPVANAHKVADLYYDPVANQFALGFDSGDDLYSGLTLTAGHIYYTAITYDGTTVTLYQYDATAGTSFTVSGARALNLTYGNGIIGKDLLALFFSGVAARVAIYATALSATQVAAHYTAGSFLGITPTQRALVTERLNQMDPPLIRTCAASVSWWCPSGVVGTYSFYNPLMLEWYNVFENAQQNNINVIVGVNSPAPFTAMSSSWCTAFADLLTQLIVQDGYTCIKYVSGLSEPDTF